ncbi:MAG: InlB B-repeat-containing protein [Clostridia bacterium]|nr:InlB B-repeat-containing protein [Clostridia bacterium]
MKLRKIIALLLAVAITVTAMGMTVFASQIDGTLSAETKFFREVDGAWVEADTVANGEKVKVRLYLDTSFYTNTGDLIFFYNNDFFEDSYEKDKVILLPSNDYYKNLGGINGLETCFFSSDSKAMENFINKGYFDREYIDNHTCVTTVYYLAPDKTNIRLNGEEWFVEFELTAKADIGASEGAIDILPSTIQSPANKGGRFNVSFGEEGGYNEDVVSMAFVNIEFSYEAGSVKNYTEYKYDLGGGTVDGESEYIEKVLIGNESAPDSVVPDKEGHTFLGWTDNGDNSYTADWSVNSYTLTFNTNGGSPVESQILDYGEEITLPSTTKTGYKFSYWTMGVSNFFKAGQKFTMPAKNITLTANWLINSHILTYSVGGEKFTHSVAVGSALPEVDMTGMENIEILYWLDENGNRTELPETMPEKNISFTAVIKYNFEGADGITATFDEGAFSNGNGVEFIGSSKSFVPAQGGTDFGGANHKQIASFGIGFNKNGSTVTPDGKVEISIPLGESYADRSGIVIALKKADGSYEKVNATVTDGKLVFKTDKFGTFDVFVPSGMRVKTQPAKASYYYKESFNISGLELEFINENGETETVTDTSAMTVTGFNPKKVGAQKLTVEYDGMSTSFTVNVSYAWWQMIIRILLLGFLWY